MIPPARRYYDQLADLLRPYLAPSPPPDLGWADSRRMLRDAPALVTDLAIPDTLDGEPPPGGSGIALFNPDRTHRFFLARVWDETRLPLVFIMLNPSTADAFVLDPTVTRCANRARALGYGGVVVLNLFAYRSTDPKALLSARDPQGGILNNSVIVAAVGALNNSLGVLANEPRIVCAWGTWGARIKDAATTMYPDAPSVSRGVAVAATLRQCGFTHAMWCLGVNADGSPKHPLYVRGDAALIPYYGTGA